MTMQVLGNTQCSVNTRMLHGACGVWNTLVVTLVLLCSTFHMHVAGTCVAQCLHVVQVAAVFYLAVVSVCPALFWYACCTHMLCLMHLLVESVISNCMLASPSILPWTHQTWIGHR
jgi:hypothetical protein